MVMDLRYVVRPLAGTSSTHESLEAAARALLDCKGHCEPVTVVIDHAKERALTASELRRLGQALRIFRERGLEVTDSGLSRLARALRQESQEAHQSQQEAA